MYVEENTFERMINQHVFILKAKRTFSTAAKDFKNFIQV